MFDYLHHYFEFIPEEEVENASPTILEAHELERDRNYYILLTTSSGFTVATFTTSYSVLDFMVKYQ